MKFWKFKDELIENKISEIDKYVVLVDRKYMNELDKYNIPYNGFSENFKKCFIVRDGRGMRKKRFNENDIKEIKDKYVNGSSYRNLAREYDCSTRTIYEILKDKY
ncbi:helix-turn-helix domain-containing protein [Clostridium thermobutyricum]